MNFNSNKQLDRYSMMIVSKYFKSLWDFIKMIQICKKFEEIPAMFHYNPVPSTKKLKLFPNIETYHIYNKNEKKIEGYNKYVYWNEVTYETYLKKKENEEYRKVKFTEYDWEKYKSFKGATLLCKKSLSQCDFEEIDLTGITKLERRCFKGNTDVKYIKLDKRISTIPHGCFFNCSSLKEMDLSYVKILENSHFFGCSSLTALTLPEMALEIGEYCFYGLNDLEKIEKKGMKVIEANMNYSLYNSFKTNGIDVKGDISFNSYDRIKYNNEIPEGVHILERKCYEEVTTLGDVILPRSVTKLDYDCFCYCSIKSIDLSHVIENKCIFDSCTAITSITLNKNVLGLSENNDYFFYNYLSLLKNIELSDTNHIPTVSNHVKKLMNEKGYHYDYCIYTKEDCNETNSIIPEEVNIIGENAFSYRNTTITITIPSKVSEICLCNFSSMNNLESIEIQSTNIKCDLKCFDNLPIIEELDLRGITSFGSHCICNCPSLTKIIIRNTPLENGLINCDSLKEIEIIGIENNEYEHPINYKIAHLLEKKGIHCKRKVLYDFLKNGNKESYCIPDGVNEIAANSFQFCELKEITIPSSVTLIKSFAISYCPRLTHIIIEGNPKIETKAFFENIQLFLNQPELKQYS